MFSNGAFDCKNCPRTADANAKRFCPAWWEQPWQIHGESVIKKDCSYRMLPDILRTLGETSVLTMSTNHEMNKRLDKAEKLCNVVSEQMQAVAKSIYVLVDMKEKSLLENNG